jgi:hypothetical protein
MGPSKFPREEHEVVWDATRGHAEEAAQHQACGEEDSIVEESLRGHEHEPQNGTNRIHLEHRPGDQAESYALALLDGDRALLWRRKLLAARVPSDVVFYVLYHPFRLLGSTVGHEPAWALRNVAANQEDPEARERAEREREPPTVELVD